MNYVKIHKSLLKYVPKPRTSQTKKEYIYIYIININCQNTSKPQYNTNEEMKISFLIG